MADDAVGKVAAGEAEPGIKVALRRAAESELGVGLDEHGTTITCQPLHVPPAFEAAEPAQGAVPIGVPLPVTVPLGGAAGSGQPGPGGMMITFSSSADVERIRSQGEENKTTNESDDCPDEDNLQWLEQGLRSAARDLDWGRRSNVGAGPESMEKVLKPASCIALETGPTLPRSVLR